MTLVDTRPGIHAALVALAAETGRPTDADGIVARPGPPVADALAPWFAEDELACGACARTLGHRRHVEDRTAGGSHAGPRRLEADAVFGDRWAGGKAQPLRMMRATALVGDHPGDMLAAAEATVTGVGVTSGSSNRDELLAAGAAVVIESLEHFPDWLASTVS